MASAHKALVLRSKDAGQFVVESRETPKPAPRELLIKVLAAALNPVDNYIQQSGYIVEHYGFPAVPGSDGAGVVEAVGEDVQGWTKGDRVLFNGFFIADRGTLQQYAISDAERTCKIPSSMTFEEAATIPLALGTAAVGLYQNMLHDYTQLGGGIGLTAPWEEGGVGKYAGQPILIIGGSSSVGRVALQLAKLSGFSPIITTASKHNEVYCETAGATHIIDYHDVPYIELPAAVAKVTSQPIKAVYDAISTQESQEAGWRILAPEGAMVLTLPAKLEASEITNSGNKRVQFTYGNVNTAENSEFGAKMYKVLPQLLEDSVIKPSNLDVCGSDLSGALAGLRRLAAGVSGVKLVVYPNSA